MDAAKADALSGVGVLVTRPLKQARLFAQRLAVCGARPILLPTIEIAPPQNAQPLRQALAHLDDYDFVMFVSINAAEHALAGLKTWPAHVRALAPGRATAETLQAMGVPVECILMPPSRFDSEGLLELPALQNMRGMRVAVMRGETGRELLGETLAARGAEVTRLVCYRRVRPAGDAMALQPLLQQKALHAVTVAATEALDNLEAMAGDALCRQLRALPLFAIHPRIVAAARQRGWEAVETASGDDGLIEGMAAYFLSRHLVEGAH